MLTGLIIGFIVGFIFGVFVMCLMSVASGADDALEKIGPMPQWEIKYTPSKEELDGVEEWGDDLS